MSLKVISCFLIGHREASASLLPRLEESIECHISCYGVNRFIVGHYGQFDQLAIQAVASARQQHPDITLYLLLPYHPYGRPPALSDIFDGSIYPEGMETVPKSVAIPRANRYMASHCDYLIAYVRHTASNAQGVMEYAMRHHVPVENLGDS